MRDLELEAAMLNRLINERQVPLQTLHLLSKDCFTSDDHLAVFSAICKLNLEGKEIDILTVSDLLYNSVPPDKVQELMYNTAKHIFAKQEVMDIFDIVHRLQEYATRRKLSLVVQKLLRLNTDMTYRLDVGVKEVRELFDRAVMGSADHFVTLGQKLDDLLVIMDENQNEESRHIGLLCGLPQIDETGGLPADGMVVIGAKSSHGKTTFATNVVVNALKSGKNVAFYSMEMSDLKVAGRILSMECGVNSNALQRLKLSVMECERVRSAVSKLKESVASHFYFDNRNLRDVDSLIMSIRALKKSHNVDCVVIDYLQLMDAPVGSRFENTNKLLGGIAHRLHDVAQDLKITILLLSQINRNVVGEPSMMHLRDSGEIAEAADMVIILYNPAFEGASLPPPYVQVDPKGKLLVKIEKNRDGSTTQFLAGFVASETRIFPIRDLKPSVPQPVEEEPSLLNLF